jgi:hypothetical protein
MTTISLTPPIRPPQATDASTGQRPTSPHSSDVAKPQTALYFSPVVRIDPQTEVAVWEIRDPETGKVTRQYPREATLKAYHAQSSEPGAAAASKDGEAKVSPEASK